MINAFNRVPSRKKTGGAAAVRAEIIRLLAQYIADESGAGQIVQRVAALAVALRERQRLQRRINFRDPTPAPPLTQGRELRRRFSPPLSQGRGRGRGFQQRGEDGGVEPMRHGGGERGAARGLRLIFQHGEGEQAGFLLFGGGLRQLQQQIIRHGAPPAVEGC